MKVLYGYDIPKEYYSKIADLDAEVFSADAEDFSGDTTMPKETIIDMLEKNITSTVIVVDDFENVVGYLHTFPMEPEFEDLYINGKATFKDLNGSKIQEANQEKINLYIWSIGIKEEYRGKKFLDKDGEKLVSVTQLLHEGLVDSLVDIKKHGTTIEKVYGEGVSEKGVEIVKRFCGENSLIHADDENEFYLYGANFDVNCKAFERCRNVNLLKDVYKENINTATVSDNCETLIDSTKLDSINKKDNREIR